MILRVKICISEYYFPCPENLNVSGDEVEGNVEIRGEQNSTGFTKDQ